MLFIAGALLLAAQSQDSLLQRIQTRIAQDSGAYVGVAYMDLGSGDTLFLNADSSCEAIHPPTHGGVESRQDC